MTLIDLTGVNSENQVWINTGSLVLFELGLPRHNQTCNHLLIFAKSTVLAGYKGNSKLLHLSGIGFNPHIAESSRVVDPFWEQIWTIGNLALLRSPG